MKCKWSKNIWNEFSFPSHWRTANQSLWDSLLVQSEWPSLRKNPTANIDEEMVTAVGRVNSPVTVEVWRFLQRLNGGSCSIRLHSTTPLPEALQARDTCTPVFIESLLAIANLRNQLRWSKPEAWIREKVYTWIFSHKEQWSLVICQKTYAIILSELNQS